MSRSLSDDELLIAFEDTALPFAEWNHRTHVRMAFVYLSRFDLESAIGRMRTGVKHYNAAHQVPDTLASGYHDTTTQAFMRLIQQALRERGPFRSSGEFCARHPELADRRVLLCYYMRDRIVSREAKHEFVTPDVTPLTQSGLRYPEFGQRVAGATYALRPGGYAVIVNAAAQIAVVQTPAGVFLPGGGQDDDESATAAIQREALEECGLLVEVDRPIGMADEFVTDQETGLYFCKRSSFHFANVVTTGQSAETDHELVWLYPQVASEQLTCGSQRWAVTRSVSMPNCST